MLTRLLISLLSIGTLASVAAADGERSSLMTSSSFGHFEEVDTTVPVPPDLQEPQGGLTLTGEPGPSQSKEAIGVYKLVVDAKGHIGSKLNLVRKDGVVGQEIALPEGKYLIQYSGTDAIVDLGASEHKIVQLSKLTVPKVDGSYKVEVFWDLTNGDQQKKVALLTWLYVEKPLSFHYVERDCWGHVVRSWDESESLSELCRTGSLMPQTRKYCAAYRGFDYTQFIGNAVKFGSDGTYSNLSQMWSRGSGGLPLSVVHEGYANKGFLEAVAGADGDTFALLPGVYGFKVTNVSGKSKTQLGLVLK